MSHEAKAPAFQTYAADFLADLNVIVMTTEEVGAYWLLTLVCWREESLPDDLEELAAIARMVVEPFEQCWAKRIRRCFIQREDGRWVHPRLEKERVKQANNREVKRRAAQARHHPEEKGYLDAPAMQMHSTRNADAQHMKCPSSSSSLSASASAPDGAEQSAKRARARPRQLPVCDEDYLTYLQANPAYKALKVRVIYAKMVAWCDLRHKEPTRARLLNWLNREDQPMNATAEGGNGNGSNREGARTGENGNQTGSPQRFKPKRVIGGSS
jgi:uncharacterized protein YdaU (DUF1376 family)